MEWRVFFLVVLLGYIAYYLINILYDLFRGRRPYTLADEGVLYHMSELMEEEETPQDVPDDGYDPVSTSPESEFEEGYDDEDEGEYEEAEYDADAPQDQELTPTLRVEGQGIPIDDFLREARSYSNTIF